MELGIYSFGERTPDSKTGRTIGERERLRRLVEEIELADRLGLDVFGVGEHHRAEFVVSTPAVVLAAAATRTTRIRLTSAVSVLSSDDPVRVFQDFATLDLISGGRAEIMAGRGSFVESFPLFGYDLHDYDALFTEKLELLLRLRDEERVRWTGHLRAPRAGHDASRLKVSINSHGFVADTSREAADTFWPPHEAVMSRIGRERGWPPQSRAQFDAQIGPRGALLVGSPAEVADKILYEHEI